METNTIGKFIAALRKAKGLTQRELAEKLNVSDKSVSRWEREECVPDLVLLPALAEIFGVTCDELLRGRRDPAGEQTAVGSSPKSEKQRKNLLTGTLRKYKNGCLIALGINAGGLIAAMICNLGFLRAWIGFFAACVFFAAGAVCQGIFLNNALSALPDDPEDREVNSCRMAFVRLAKTTFGTSLMVLAFHLPLLLLAEDTYMGLSGDSWLLWGLVFALGMLLLWALVCHFLNGWLVDRGICRLEPQAEEIFRHNRYWKRRCALLLLAAFLATGVLQAAANACWNPWELAKGTTFDNYEDFKAYMETETWYEGSGSLVHAPTDTVYYDMYGNEISREEALREELRISDGTEEGKVVCTYLHLNYNVVSIRQADTEDGLPVMVITGGDMHAARSKKRLINLAFLPLYAGELAALWYFYRKKRR